MERWLARAAVDEEPAREGGEATLKTFAGAARRAVPALALMTACDTSHPVRIGVVFLRPNLPAAFLAADEVNGAGGIRGRPLRLVVDTVPSTGRSRGEEIEAARRMLSGPPLIAVVGHGYSQATLVAAPYYNAAGIVQIDPTGNSRQLRDAGPWTVHLAPYDSTEGAFIAAWLRDSLRVSRVAVFYLNDEAGRGIRDGLRASLADSPVRVVRELRVDSASDYGSLVSAALAERPDAVVLATWENHALAITGLIRRAGSSARIIATDGVAVLPWFTDSLGPAGDGMLAAGFWLPDPADSASLLLMRALSPRLGRAPTSAEAMLYDAVMLVATAARAVGEEPGAIRGYLMSLGRSREPYRGVSGPIAPRGPGGSGRMVMGMLRNGRLEPATAALLKAAQR